MGLAVGFLVLRAVAAWLRRTWKPGAERMAYAIGWLVGAWVFIAVVSTRLAAAEAKGTSDPQAHVYLLAGASAQLMNAGFFGGVLGLLLGVLLEWRMRKVSARG